MQVYVRLPHSCCEIHSEGIFSNIDLKSGIITGKYKKLISFRISARDCSRGPRLWSQVYIGDGLCRIIVFLDSICRFFIGINNAICNRPV